MLSPSSSTPDIKNHLGHGSVQSTMVYLHMNLSCKREVQKKFIEYTQSILTHDPKIEYVLLLFSSYSRPQQMLRVFVELSHIDMV
jgi:hypothetical protein